LTQALLPMLKAQQGQVVFINSSSALTAKPMTAQYDSTKHALKAIADSLRAEVNKHGVRVLSVYLGRTVSEMQERIHQRREGPIDQNSCCSPTTWRRWSLTRSTCHAPPRNGYLDQADDQVLIGQSRSKAREFRARNRALSAGRISRVSGALNCTFQPFLELLHWSVVMQV
jgi:short-subunit dehydrogenase